MSAKIAIVVYGAVFADALVAGAMSARRLIPVLAAYSDELSPQVAVFLDDAGVEHVVLMGATAAITARGPSRDRQLGNTADPMADAAGFETAILTRRYAAEPDSEECYGSGSVALACARVLFDTFSAAALMTRRCAALVLTAPDRVSASTADSLDGVRSRSLDEVKLTVLGADTAASQAAGDPCLETDTPGKETDQGSDAAQPPPGCGASFADPPLG